jgi:hypothetical protein
MADMGNLAYKFRRALRSGVGLRLTTDELRALAEHGALELLAEAENEELKSSWAAKTPPPSTETSGSTSAATGARRTSGRSPGTTRQLGRSGIAALARHA